MNFDYNRLKAVFESKKREFYIFFSLFILIFSMVRLYPQGSVGNVEQWINLTNSMFARSQDFLFSYGPLYWLVGGATTPYSATTYWCAILFLSLNFAFFWTVMILLCIKFKKYFVFGLAFLLFILTLQVNSALFLWPLMILAYIELYKERESAISWQGYFILGLIVGFEFYVRFFFGLVASAIFASYIVSHFRNRSAVTSLVAFGSAIILSYVAIGLVIFHDAISILNYLKINMQLNFGNSVDMTLDVSNTVSTYVCVSIVLLCFIAHCILVKRYLLLTYVGLWVILFKLGFGRSDHYNTYFVVPMVIMSLLLACDRLPLGRVTSSISLLSLLYLASHQTFPGAATMNPFATAFNFSSSYNDRLVNTYTEYKLDSKFIDEIKNSTIDVYPYNNEYLIANNLNYVTRPLFQNYMTLTPVLDGMNKAFFESKERPEFVLWTGGLTCYSKDCNIFEGFDYKYSLNEDPLTSTSILNNYDIHSVTKGRGDIPVVLMKAKPDIHQEDYTTIATQEMSFGTWYNIPKGHDGIIKVQPDFEFTLAGRLKNLLFRGGIVKVKYKLENGEVKEYRLNILNASSGVWASPLLTGLTPDGIQGEKVKSVMFETSSVFYLKPSFQAKFIALNNSDIQIKPRVINYNKAAVLSGINSVTPVLCDGSIDEINSKPAAQAGQEESAGLQVKGWLAASSAKGVLYDKSLLVLKSKEGEPQYFTTDVSNRPDVADAFHHPVLAEAGFSTLVDIRNMDGDYSVSLAGVRGNQLFSCTNTHFNLKFVH